jgi:hypothetical protein
VGLLFWLPIEDTSVLFVYACSGGIVILAAIQQGYRFAQTPCKNIWTRHPASGMILGVTFPLLAGLLMVFKNGVHAHAFPDFSTSDLVQVISWTPWSALAGGILGLAASFWRWSTCR